MSLIQGGTKAPQMDNQQHVVNTNEAYPGADVPEKDHGSARGQAEVGASVWQCHGCKDILFALMFYAALLATVILCGEHKGEEEHLDINTSGDHLDKYLGIAVGVCCAWVVLWIVIMWACARCLIYFGFAVCFVLLVFGAIWAFGNLYWLAGILFSVMAFLLVGYFLCIKARIKLATKMIHICVGVLFKSPFVFVAAFLVVACMVGFFVLCAIAALRTCGYYHGQDNDSTAWGLFFFFLLFALWGLEICRNVVHVTACGVLGQWYFSNHTLTTFPCLLRAVTVNFGSICLGSLLVAIVETIRAVLLWIKERQCASNCCVTFVFCCIDCCLGCIQSIFELINAYAFVHCAIYGEGFCHAAKSALQFLEGAALTAIISDDIIKRFLFAGSFIGAFFNGCFIASLGKDENNFTGEEAAAWGVSIGTVSYTHLTLPTKRIV
eukprot:TRINITY_DN8037_c0_g1_i3.p1 TRINITY_DN8037_c0_g1~~TRINITY_DN8037_c0_g1_i3.p1  ORF type:complete len:437 (-),score=90.00 TRINITY_DN8037_c0_g1_i3:96-1406(-)